MCTLVHTPYSIKQAHCIHDDYKYLVGDRLVEGGMMQGSIGFLMITPFDEFNKFRFLKEFSRTRDEKKAMQFYDGSLYDLVLIGVKKNILNTSFRLIDYLGKIRMVFNYKKYAAIK